MAIRYRREGLRVVREEREEGGSGTPPTPAGPAGSASAPSGAPVSPALRARRRRFRDEVLADVSRRRRLGLVADRSDWRTPKTPHGITGEQLAQARRVLGLSQRQLADRMLCSRSAIAEAERGRRPVLPNVAAWVGQTLRVTGLHKNPPEAEDRR